MKNVKTILSILVLSLFIVGCSDTTNGSDDAEKETKVETNDTDDMNEQTSEETDKDSEKETEEQEKVVTTANFVGISKDTNTGDNYALFKTKDGNVFEVMLDDKSLETLEKDNSNGKYEVTHSKASSDTTPKRFEKLYGVKLVESKNENVEQGKVIEIKEEGKSDSEAKVIDTVDTTKSADPKLNNEMTKEMLEDMKDFHITLVSSKNATFDDFPKENLQAIAKYDSDESYGWVIRYGVNKVGLAQYYKESKTKVIVMFDSKSILESKEDPIKDDEPKEYKEVAEKILEKEITGSFSTQDAY